MPPTGAEQKTTFEDVEIVRRMAPRYGDDQIAAVLNRLGRKTGKGKRWSRISVRTVCRNYAIDGTGDRVIDPETLSMEPSCEEVQCEHRYDQEARHAWSSQEGASGAIRSVGASPC